MSSYRTMMFLMHWDFLLLPVDAGQPVGTVGKRAGDWRGRAAGRTVRPPTAAANWLVQEGSSSLSFHERGTTLPPPRHSATGAPPKVEVGGWEEGSYTLTNVCYTCAKSGVTS